MSKNFRYYFLVGLFSIIPVAATWWLMDIIFRFFAGPAQSIIVKIIPYEFMGQKLLTWAIGF